MTRLTLLRQTLTVGRGFGVALLVAAALAPIIGFSSYWVNSILTQALWLGIAAASLIFLSAYGGMVSLGQVAMYGIAGITLGNVVSNGGSKGLNLGWNPWLGVVLGIAIATAIGLLFGALASRSTGIYFLMITLTFSVIANYFFGQVTVLSGFGGINNIRTPSLIGNPNLHHNRLYYVALVVAVFVYALIRYVIRTPFGLTLQGIRDDPVKMSSLGYNVPLHRTLAFGFASLIASLAGVLFVWWNGHIDPGTINLTAVLTLLTIAVIGGLYRIEGAWVGALAYVLIQNYVRDVTVPFIGGSFNTVIGLIFLAIIILSPGGLMGLWGTGGDVLRRAVLGRRPSAGAAPGVSARSTPGGAIARSIGYSRPVRPRRRGRPT